MRKPLFAIAPYLIACGFAAQAQTFEISVVGAYPRFGRPLLGSVSAEQPQDNDTSLKGRHGAGVRFTMNQSGYYGHELGFIRSRTRLRTTVRATVEEQTVATTKQDTVNVDEVSYNFLIYWMPRGERWRPFMTGGLQMFNYGAPRIEEWDAGSSRHYGANYGLGLKIKLFPHAQARLDFRHYIGGKPYKLTFKDELRSGGLLHQLELSVGLGVTF